MRKSCFLFFGLFLILSTTTSAQGVNNLSPELFHKQTRNTNSRAFYILDVRTPGEFNSGHIANAENIDFNDRKFSTEIQSLDKNKPTYVYCLSGGRSSQAAQILQDKGFKKVYNLEGGIKAWREAKLAVEGDMTSKAGLSMAEFKKMVDQDVPVLVDFTAKWCGPCRALKPRIERLASKTGDDLKIIYIDIDKNRALSNELKIRMIPLLHLYKRGKLKRVRNQAISYRALEKFIR
jgi:rhodanese-related sulfurtransferase